MTRNAAAALAALLILAGCESDDPAQQLEPTGMTMIGGDGDVVAIGAAPAAVRLASAEAIEGDTLIVQILGDTVETSSSLLGTDPVGLSSVLADDVPPVPAGTGVDFRVLRDGCGEPFLSGTQDPDSLAQVRNLWEVPGSRVGLTGTLPADLLGWYEVEGDSVWAAACPLEYRLRVGSTFSVADTAVRYFEPGPATSLVFATSFPQRLFVGDSVVAPLAGASDEHGNALPQEWISYTGLEEGHVLHPAAEGLDTVTASIDGLTTRREIEVVQKMGEGWTFRLRCGAGIVPWWYQDQPVDSVVVDLTTDSATADLYSAILPPEPWTYDGSLRFSKEGSRTAIYYPDGSTDIREGIRGLTWAFSQAPGQLAITVRVPSFVVMHPEPAIFAGSGGNPPGVYTSTDVCGEAPTIEATLTAPTT